MRKFWLLGAACFLLGAGSANAADPTPSNMAAKAGAPAVFDWSGMYVGAHAGYGWGDYDSPIVAGGVPVNLTAKPDGWLGGLQIGYNVQFAPHWLIGGEIDYAWADITERFPSGLGVPTPVKVKSFGSARTRFGYVADRTLFYVTGGLAWAHSEGVNFATKTGHYGWTVGGGIEYALDPRWSVKLEYLYADFGRNHGNVGNLLSQSVDLTMNVVRAGINYRFGGPSAQPQYMPVKAYRPAGDPWAGAYAGLHGGYGWSHFGISSFPEPDGFFGGFQTGYNWHFAPAWLLGIETDTSFGDLSASATLPGSTIHAKIDRFATARLRFGYVAGPSLWYATGGVAVADLKWSASSIFGTQNVKALNVGWTAGGGIEYAIDPDWSIKAEYLYTGFRESSFAPSDDVTMQTVKVGLNYHGPVIERLFGGR